jgi:hypothetical protein
MHQHSEIVLAQTKTTSLCMYVVWAFGLVVFNLVVIAFVRGIDGVSCVFAVTPALSSCSSGWACLAGTGFF